MPIISRHCRPPRQWQTRSCQIHERVLLYVLVSLIDKEVLLEDEDRVIVTGAKVSLISS